MILEKFRRKLNESLSGSPLDPPATPTELEWWRTAKIPIRRADVLRNGLLVQLPIWLGNAIHSGVDGFRRPSFWIFTVAIGVGTAALTGWYTWASGRKMKMRSAIIGKRLREGILNPPETDPAAISRP